MIRQDWLSVQPTSALSEALVSVTDAIAGDTLGLLSLLDPWDYYDALQSELSQRSDVDGLLDLLAELDACELPKVDDDGLQGLLDLLAELDSQRCPTCGRPYLERQGHKRSQKDTKAGKGGKRQADIQQK